MIEKRFLLFPTPREIVENTCGWKLNQQITQTDITEATLAINSELERRGVESLPDISCTNLGSAITQVISHGSRIKLNPDSTLADELSLLNKQLNDIINQEKEKTTQILSTQRYQMAGLVEGIEMQAEIFGNINTLLERVTPQESIAA